MTIFPRHPVLTEFLKQDTLVLTHLNQQVRLNLGVKKLPISLNQSLKMLNQLSLKVMTKTGTLTPQVKDSLFGFGTSPKVQVIIETLTLKFFKKVLRYQANPVDTFMLNTVKKQSLRPENTRFISMLPLTLKTPTSPTVMLSL